MHVQRLVNSKGRVDHEKPTPMRHKHIKSNSQIRYFGSGPKQSLDQKITFINENNCLAKRITEIGNRNNFGLLPKSQNMKTRKPSFGHLQLPGIEHKVGTLNSGKRKAQL